MSSKVLIGHAVFLFERGYKQTHTYTHKVTDVTNHPSHESAIADVGNKVITAALL